jgi:hypothetical protein
MAPIGQEAEWIPKRENLDSVGNRTPTVQHVGRRNIDWAIPTTSLYGTEMPSCTVHCHQWTNFSSHVTRCITSENTRTSALSPVHDTIRLNCPLANSTTRLYRRRHSGSMWQQAVQAWSLAVISYAEGGRGGWIPEVSRTRGVSIRYLPKFGSRDDIYDRFKHSPSTSGIYEYVLTF